MITTSSPRARRNSETLLPINPAPPVTSTFLYPTWGSTTSTSTYVDDDSDAEEIDDESVVELSVVATVTTVLAKLSFRVFAAVFMMVL